MIKAPVPVDDEQRVADLRRLDLLLNEPEEVFDRMTEELARIFDVPAVVMSFIDEDTQYYKSTVGPLPDDVAETRTEPREISVCSYVAGENRMMVVHDLLADDRFRDNPYVLSSGARFYAGTPLRSESGRAIGTLCIVDTEPRTLSDRERDLLELIADGIMAQVNLRSASRQLLKRTKQIERDLQQAVQMQRFLLPPQRQEGDRWRVTHLYRPYEHLGGDFVDVHQRPDGKLALLVADVSGHGTSSALTVAMAKTAFHRVAARVAAPAELLSTLNREMIGIVPPNQFMTTWAGLFNPPARELLFASAGHPYPLRIHGDQVEVARHANEITLLIDPDHWYANHTKVALAPGDRLLVYTDGAIEAADPGGHRLDVAGLAGIVGELVAETPPPPDFLAALMGRLRQHARNRFTDDVALLCIESV